jgi:hypothetical protein
MRFVLSRKWAAKTMNTSVAQAKPHSNVAGKHVPPPKDTAQYIADMVLELRNLAKGAGLITLQGLLEVSFYEAFSAANHVEVPQHELDHLRELSKASHS